MASRKDSIVALELLILTAIGALIYTLFSQGVSWVYVQLISFLIFVGALLPLNFEAKARGISVLNAKSMVLLGVLAWILLDPLTMREEIKGFSPQNILAVFLMVIIFLTMLNLGYFIRWPNFFERIFRKLDYGYSFSQKKLLYFITIAFFILNIS